MVLSRNQMTTPPLIADSLLMKQQLLIVNRAR